jgi:MFS family permease
MNLTEANEAVGPKKIFYGWWVVLTAGIGLLFGYAPIFVFSFGVFVRSFVEEFHSNRTQISLAFTLASLMVSVGSPLAGRLVDRFGARRVLLPSIGILGSHNLQVTAFHR